MNTIVAHGDYTVNEYSTSSYPNFIVNSKNVSLEIFTATWCGWCHKAYELFDSLQEQFGDQHITNIRYHCQDEISMSTIEERTDYYGISGFPTIITNGTNKQTGVSEEMFATFSKMIEDELSTQSELAIHSNISVRENRIYFDVFLQTQDRQIEGEFMGFTMISGVNAHDNVYDYVADAVFPSFDGLHLVLNPKSLYHVHFYIPMDSTIDPEYYSTLCIFQNLATKQIYNSDFTSLYAEVPISTNPVPFEKEVNRDSAFKIQLQDGIILKTIQSEYFYFQDNTGEIIPSEWSYNPSIRELTIRPVSLLKPDTNYVLFIKGGKDSFLSTNHQTLYTDLLIPFTTSNLPEIDMQYSRSEYIFEDVSVIDTPHTTFKFKELHGNPVRVNILPGARWISCTPESMDSSEGTIDITLDPLFMVVGKNTGFIEVKSIAGTHIIRVEANRRSDKYPTIRLDSYPLLTFEDSISITGKTDGYKVYVKGNEIEVDLDGNFSFHSSLHYGINYIHIEAKNMRGKKSSYPLMVIRLEKEE